MKLSNFPIILVIEVEQVLITSPCYWKKQAFSLASTVSGSCVGFLIFFMIEDKFLKMFSIPVQY